MKIYNITDVEGFFKIVDSCEGRVELVTGEGDRLNLKSTLTQYVALAKVFADKKIPEMELVVYNQADISKFISFMMNNQ